MSHDLKSNLPATRRPSVLRASLAGLGIVLIAIGIPIGFLTPFPMVPIGLTIVLTGAALLARNSDAGRAWLARTVTKHQRIRRMTPDWLQKLVFGDVIGAEAQDGDA